MIILDNFSIFFNVIILIITFLTILISISYLERMGINYGEYYSLILFSAVGMMVLSSSTDLITIFIGLEIMSIAIYILAGFNRESMKSNESALKYFLLGSFATGFFLYGISLIYGATGTTNIRDIALKVNLSPLILAGIGFIIVGFAFKVSLVPFHMWTPDVYEGAPTSVTAFMSAGVKVSAFAAFLRVLLISFPVIETDWSKILWALSIITMTLGNIVALSQTNLKRMLAYSSIAHAGYILIGFVAGGNLGSSSILFYLLSYTFMNMGAFGVIILLGEGKGEGDNLVDFSGIGFRRPFLAFCMTVFMLSLAGIPPTSGFVGKFYIFSSAVKTGYIDLAIIGVLNSLISLYYYLRVIVYMYMKEPEKEIVFISLKPALTFALLISLIATIHIGIFPSNYLYIAKECIRVLVG
jgi:NADH-quinone oxidoreductase subunit N